MIVPQKRFEKCCAYCLDCFKSSRHVCTADFQGDALIYEEGIGQCGCANAGWSSFPRAVLHKRDGKTIKTHDKLPMLNRHSCTQTMQAVAIHSAEYTFTSFPPLHLPQKYIHMGEAGRS